MATGAGQLELFAVGATTYNGSPIGNASLYRWRFNQGGWTQAQPVAWDLVPSAALFGQQAATTWGDGTVDLIVVQDGTGTVFHTRFLAAPVPSDQVTLTPGAAPGPPAAVFTSLGGRAVDVPVLTAFSAQRLGLIEIGTDNYPYENWATHAPAISGRTGRAWTPEQLALGLNLRWSGFQPLASTTLTGGGATRLSEGEAAAVAMDPDGRAYINHYTRYRWIGFLPLPRLPIPNAPQFKPSVLVYYIVCRSHGVMRGGAPGFSALQCTRICGGCCIARHARHAVLCGSESAAGSRGASAHC